MDVAELYLSLVRPNGVPVVGECMADPPFTGQIQVEKWTWELMNDDEVKADKEDEERISAHDTMLTQQPSVDLRKRLAQLNRKKEVQGFQDQRSAALDTLENARKADGATKEKVAAAEKAYRKTMDKIGFDETKAGAKFELDFKALSQDLSADERRRYKELDKMVGDAEDKAQQLQDKIKATDEAVEEANKSYKFSFSKRVDFATTQMLNSMKAGDVFPLGVLTIHQRSSNAGMSLVFTVTNLRLLTYAVRADVGETMTDMKEQWTAEFRSLAYVYKNRKITDGLGSASEAAAKVATQNTVRTFAMKKDLGI